MALTGSVPVRISEQPPIGGLAAGSHGRRHPGQLSQDRRGRHRRRKQGGLRRRRHHRVQLAGAEGQRRREVIHRRVRYFHESTTDSTISKGCLKAILVAFYLVFVPVLERVLAPNSIC